MQPGFPLSHVELLRCPRDGGTLSTRVAPAGGAWIESGTLVCASCGHTIEIREGIARVLDEAALADESAHEREVRDAEADEYDARFGGRAEDDMEIRPTMSALRLSSEMLLLELGCGTGRHTAHVAERVALVLAVDFSGRSLALLRRKLPPDARVGLVHADVTRLAVAPGRFHRVLSTLVSNLPAPEHRSAMFGLAARALTAGGRFVFGAHHYGIRARLAGEAQSARYSEGGIYRFYFRRREIDRETRAFFRRVRIRSAQIGIPFARRLGLAVQLSLLASWIPVVRDLGLLLIVTAEEPLPPPG